MTLSPDDLRRIAERTLAHYDQRATDYWEGTRDHDVTQNIKALLDHIQATPPSICWILDAVLGAACASSSRWAIVPWPGKLPQRS